MIYEVDGNFIDLSKVTGVTKVIKESTDDNRTVIFKYSIIIDGTSITISLLHTWDNSWHLQKTGKKVVDDPDTRLKLLNGLCKWIDFKEYNDFIDRHYKLIEALTNVKNI
jgi:hypothetical protein